MGKSVAAFFQADKTLWNPTAANIDDGLKIEQQGFHAFDRVGVILSFEEPPILFAINLGQSLEAIEQKKFFLCRASEYASEQESGTAIPYAAFGKVSHQMTRVPRQTDQHITAVG